MKINEKENEIKRKLKKMKMKHQKKKQKKDIYTKPQNKTISFLYFKDQKIKYFQFIDKG